MFVLRSIETRITYQTIDAIPIHHVDHVGVRYFGWIFASALGAAPWAAIESVVRAVGRIVVCVEAIAEVITASTRILFHGLPTIPVSTSSGWFTRNPGPCRAVEANATTT